MWNITNGNRGLITGNTSDTLTVQILEYGTDNDFDSGNSIKIANGYPCLDQIGRSTSQKLLPLFEWNKTRNGTDANIVIADNFSPCDCPSQPDHINY